MGIYADIYLYIYIVHILYAYKYIHKLSLNGNDGFRCSAAIPGTRIAKELRVEWGPRSCDGAWPHDQAVISTESPGKFIAQPLCQGKFNR